MASKVTKGSIALGAAAVLLMGGAGSLAYWSDDASVEGGDIASGDLALDDENCGTGTGTHWYLDGDEDAADKEYVAGDLLVPGDTLSKTCTYTVSAKGEHLRATVAASAPTASGDLAGALTLTPSFAVGDSAVTEITEAQDGETLTVTYAVTFNGASGNDTKNLTATLNDYTVTLTQVHN